MRIISCSFSDTIYGTGWEELRDRFCNGPVPLKVEGQNVGAENEIEILQTYKFIETLLQAYRKKWCCHHFFCIHLSN